MVNTDTVSCAQTRRDLSINPNVEMEEKICRELWKAEIICQMQAFCKVIKLEELRSIFSDFWDLCHLCSKVSPLNRGRRK